jgi:hypothetical protein
VPSLGEGWKTIRWLQFFFWGCTYEVRYFIAHLHKMMSMYIPLVIARNNKQAFGILTDGVYDFCWVFGIQTMILISQEIELYKMVLC